MKALIAVASRHGSTRQIAQAIAQELRMAELTVDQRDVDEVASVDGYEAVVLGSAVYMGKWLPEAQHFVERCQTKLATVPVWLFSSGPLGAIDPQPHGDPTQLPKLLDVTRARDHRVFVGRLDPGSLGLGERLIAKVVRAPEGDFRDWEAVQAWAREIAAELAVPGRER